MSRRAFTLIELMIVIAIIAVIAAIAIPGLLAAQRSSNERNGSACLKMIATVQADFRSNDRDGDRQLNFYVGGIYPLYALCPSTNALTLPPLTTDNMIKLIEPSIAGADGNVNATALGCVTVGGSLGGLSPKASYIYRAFGTFATTGGTSTYATNGGVPGYGQNFNFAKFAFMCFPSSYSVGRQVFMMDETGTVFRGDPGSAYAAAYAGGGSSSTSSWSGSVGGAAADDTMAYPVAPMAVGWAKLD